MISNMPITSLYLFIFSAAAAAAAAPAAAVAVDASVQQSQHSFLVKMTNVNSAHFKSIHILCHKRFTRSSVPEK